MTGLQHMSLAWVRVLLRRSPDYFIDKTYAKAGLGIVPLKNLAGEPVVCQVCGYAIMHTRLPNGWVYETCSAFMPVKFIGDDSNYKDWISQLPSDGAGNESPELSRCGTVEEPERNMDTSLK